MFYYCYTLCFLGNVNAWHGFIDVVSNQGSPDSVGVVVATSDGKYIII